MQLNWWPIVGVVGYILLWHFTYLWFVAIMHMKRVKKELEEKGETLTTPQKINGYLFLVEGYALDFLLNVLTSFPLLDPPRELLLTGKLTRLKKKSNWQGDIAREICSKWLDDFDGGCHCK